MSRLSLSASEEEEEVVKEEEVEVEETLPPVEARHFL